MTGIGPDLVGRTGEPVEFAWDADDVQLYALAVGAGQDPLDELASTTENSDGVALTVLPTFLNIVTRSARVDYDVDRTKLVHAEQSFTLAGPLPTGGRARVTARVTEVWDKGSAALVTTEAEAVDAGTGAPLGTSRQTVFVRGAGGFGGERGPAAPDNARPDRAPDHQVTLTTRPEQALLYRLTGDRNPLHSDPAFAARAGFERPILHGMCTYGFAGRVLLAHACGGDPARFGAMSARFSRPVLPGDELRVALWLDDAGADFVTTRGDDVVLDRGRLALR